MDCIIECLFPSVFIAVITNITAVYVQAVGEVSDLTVRMVYTLITNLMH